MKPLAVDLCCGLGGWSHGLLAEGWDVVGFDIEKHEYGDDKYPAQLVLQDIRTLDGRQFRGKVKLITASPPCQRYSYMAMPWSRSKALAAWYRDPAHPERIVELNALFDACVRIGKEAECPIVIENVRGCQPWVGRSRWNFGSYHLFGDVPALMPMAKKLHKVGSLGWSEFAKTGKKSKGFNTTADQIVHGRASSDCTYLADAGKKIGGDWFNDRTPGCHAMCGSKSKARKAASAAIAKIPFALARHIARYWAPQKVVDMGIS